MLASIRDQFNRKFQTDWGFKNTGRVIDYDASVYLELQEDKGKQIAWLKDAPLHLRRKLEIMGESDLGYTEEQLASIIIGSGSTTLDDVLAGSQQNIQPVPGLNDYGK